MEGPGRVSRAEPGPGLLSVSAARVDGEGIDCLRVFRPTRVRDASAFRISKRFDIPEGSLAAAFRVNTAYKRKAQKVRPVDSSDIDRSYLDRGMGWKADYLLRESHRPLVELGRYSR